MNVSQSSELEEEEKRLREKIAAARIPEGFRNPREPPGGDVEETDEEPHQSTQAPVAPAAGEQSGQSRRRGSKTGVENRKPKTAKEARAEAANFFNTTTQRMNFAEVIVFRY